MTPSDLVFALEHLHFGRNRNALGALRIDRPVRDFIVAALRRNGPGMNMLKLSDRQLADVMAVGRAVPRGLRDAFLQAVADELKGRADEARCRRVRAKQNLFGLRRARGQSRRTIE